MQRDHEPGSPRSRAFFFLGHTGGDLFRFKLSGGTRENVRYRKR